jgi:hypothetical protein
MTSRAKRLATRVKAKHMSRVGDMMLSGHTDKSKMAAALGLSPRTVANYMDEIRRDWLNSDKRSFAMKVVNRVRQCELAMQESFEAFKRSQQNEVETRVVLSAERCRAQGCENGMVNGEEWCEECGGNGTVDVETTTTRVRGQAGDSSLLNAFIKAVAEAAKLEGLYVTRVEERRTIDKAVMHLNGNQWSEASSEVLLKARRVLDGLRNGTKVIDVKGE